MKHPTLRAVQALTDFLNAVGAQAMMLKVKEGPVYTIGDPAGPVYLSLEADGTWKLARQEGGR